ncbi:DUF4837 family protein [Confluentibacter sediminis]|uniref:DUF4837 family protein n=1 Tax=Confluentibacter sediminis TaxID=2219045 RepID=UPI000DAEDCB8|nr:DUF4837 family protein [Confluentibacter sediminis]
MQKFLLVTGILLLALSCKDGKSSNEKMLLDSTGKINDVFVVIDNDLWSGAIGGAIRNILAAPVYGLPQDEPLFNINQIPTQVFSGFVTKNRTVLIIKMDKESSISFDNNVYAKPQRVITISGKNKQDIIDQLNENAPKIISTFKNIEIFHKQQQIRKVLFNTKSIQDQLKLNIDFTTAYRIAKNENEFFWIRRDTDTGSLNIMLYELPYSAIQRNDSIINQIIKIRDSIAKKYIEGPVEGSYMTTENAYTPFNTETILDNKPTLETKGMWDVENAVMAGPFINYAIEDKTNKRWVIAEGFAFAPSVEKRDFMFELEAIIRSIKIQ